MRPHRLAWPRTPAFHAGDRGSNPLGDATFQKKRVESKDSALFFYFLYQPYLMNSGNNPSALHEFYQSIAINEDSLRTGTDLHHILNFTLSTNPVKPVL